MLRLLLSPLYVKFMTCVFFSMARFIQLFSLTSRPNGSPSKEKILIVRLEHALYQIEFLKFANRMLQQKL